MPTAVCPHLEASVVLLSSNIHIVLAKFDSADSILPSLIISGLESQLSQIEQYIFIYLLPIIQKPKTGFFPSHPDETMENFEKSPSIFAVMIPANNAARASFSQVAQKMLEDKDWNPTARQNIQANEESIQVSTDSSVSENDGNNTTPKPSSPASIGCYVFDFANPPRQPGNGWLIGSGKFSGCELSPDILLTERKNHDHVSSRHARLGHNFKSGALVVTTSDSRIVAIDGEDLKHGDGEGSKDDDISKRGQRVIHKKTTSLEFGELKYRLELRTYDLDIHFRQDLKVYKNMNGIMDADYPPILLATPAKSDHVIQEYILKNPVGEGSTCVVYAAHDRRNGDAVAVKKVKRSRSNAKSIDRDCAISAYLGKHVGESSIACRPIADIH